LRLSNVLVSSHLLIRTLYVRVTLRAALVSGVALGLANPSLGCLADRYSLSKFSTFGIFIISGLCFAFFPPFCIGFYTAL
jgi:F0F1-type ATP synthase assembly protein I